MHRHTRTALLAAALLLAACDQPAGGGGGPRVTNPPETAARELTLGQPVDESLESGTDVDDFAVTIPSAGRGMLLIVGTGSGQGSITLTAVDSATGAHVATATAHGTSEGGERFNLPAGRLLIRAKSTGTTGGYRFAVHAIATGPDSGEGPFAVRQWAAGSLAPYYDVDEYAFDGVEGQEIKLYLNAQGGFLQASLRGPGAAELVLARSWLWSGETETVRLPVTGRYTVAVSTPDPADARQASPYRLMVFPINRAPEGVPAALQHGQTVSEALDVHDDVDEYTFTAAQGDIIQWFFEVPPPGGPQFQLIDPASGQVLRPGPTPFDVPRDGEYRVRIFGGMGPYTLQLFRIDPRPEQVSASITLGQTVEGESIQPSSDVDLFRFTGTAGTEIAMHVQGPPGSWLYLLPDEGDEPLLRLLVLWPGEMEVNTSERFVLPRDGTYRVRMARHGTQASGVSGPPVGPYRFKVAPVGHAPESVPAAIQIDETVTGESLEHRADVDVFTFHAQAGDRLTLWGAKGVMGLSGELAMTIQRPGPEVQPPLAYIWAPYNTFMGNFQAPETGTYEVRVFSASATSLAPLYMSDYRGPYQLAVRRRD
jgi:hypothetical protein